MLFYIMSLDGFVYAAFPFPPSDTLGLMNQGDGRDDLNALRPLHDQHRVWRKPRHPDRLGTLFFYFVSQEGGD